MSAQHLRTIKVLDRPVRLFQSPLQGPDYPWAALADLLVPGAAATRDFEDYAERLSAEQPSHATYVLTPSGQELVVSSFVVDGILGYQAEQGSEQVRKARDEFRDGMAEVFAMQHAGMPHEEFRRLCVIAAARHDLPAGCA